MTIVQATHKRKKKKKVFMTASAEERARRRVGEYEKAGGAAPSYEEVMDLCALDLFEYFLFPDSCRH